MKTGEDKAAGVYVPLGGSKDPVAYCAYHKATLSAEQMRLKECRRKNCNRLCIYDEHPFWVKKQRVKENKEAFKKRVDELSQKKSGDKPLDKKALIKVLLINDIYNMEKGFYSGSLFLLLEFMYSLGLFSFYQVNQDDNYCIVKAHIDENPFQGIVRCRYDGKNEAAEKIFEQIARIAASNDNSELRKELVVSEPDISEIVRYVENNYHYKRMPAEDTLAGLYAKGLISKPVIKRKDKSITVSIPGIKVSGTHYTGRFSGAVSKLFRKILELYYEETDEYDETE